MLRNFEYKSRSKNPKNTGELALEMFRVLPAEDFEQGFSVCLDKFYHELYPHNNEAQRQCKKEALEALNSLNSQTFGETIASHLDAVEPFRRQAVAPYLDSCLKAYNK